MNPDFICDVCKIKTPEYHYGGKCRECARFCCSNCISHCPVCNRFICRVCADPARENRCKNRPACEEARKNLEIRKVLGDRETDLDEAAREAIRRDYAVCPTCNEVVLKKDLGSCAECRRPECPHCRGVCKGCGKTFCRFHVGAVSGLCRACRDKESQGPPPGKEGGAMPSGKPPAGTGPASAEAGEGPPKPEKSRAPVIAKMRVRAPWKPTSLPGLLILLPASYLLAVLALRLFSPVIGFFSALSLPLVFFLGPFAFALVGFFAAGAIFCGFAPPGRHFVTWLMAGALAGALGEYWFGLIWDYWDAGGHLSHCVDNMAQSAVMTAALFSAMIDNDRILFSKKKRKIHFSTVRALAGGATAAAAWTAFHLLAYSRVSLGKTILPPSAFLAQLALFFAIISTWLRWASTDIGRNG